MAKRLLHARRRATICSRRCSALDLRVGDVVLVEAGDIIPADGEVIEGIASVNESAITGESAPVIRESGGDRSAVTGGTTVLSDWIKVQVTAAPGSTFLDRMIALVEGAERQKTPNELALSILLVRHDADLPDRGRDAVGACRLFRHGARRSRCSVALLVTLIPTTIGGLLSAIGIAGMDRLIRFNVLATSGRAVEAAGDVDTLLLDKTGTITFGNRLATAFIPVPGVTERTGGSRAARLACRRDAGGPLDRRAGQGQAIGIASPTCAAEDGKFMPFSAMTRISGVDLGGRSIRKGAVDAVLKHRRNCSRSDAAGASARRSTASRARGGTPLAVAEDGRLLGVIHLKDVVKPDIKERFDALARAWASAR